ncbi:phosphatidate cytidylyltransferase [Candidatus Saccharibacteria bacterium]|nr:phosphatidate cytidylyltransferase [Candidatus Saccharibacteria bacterium]
MKKLLKSENFRERLITSTLLAVLIVLSLITVEARGFRFIFVFAGIVATAEFLLTARERVLAGDLRDDRSVLLELVLILVGVGAVFFNLTRSDIILILVSAVSNDVLAYFTGNLFHNKIFKAKPFPRISPKKSWEGLIGGYLGSIIITFLTMKLLGVFNLCFLLLAPSFAIFGDWLESFTKRTLEIKDSNEMILERNLFGLKPFERIMAGHGGYGDRIDSWVAVSTLMFWIKLTR